MNEPTGLELAEPLDRKTYLRWEQRAPAHGILYDVDQPILELMFRPPQGVVAPHLVLRPGGENVSNYLVAAWLLYRSQTFASANPRLACLGQSNRLVRLRLEAATPDACARSSTDMQITYDAALGSYRYRFDQELEVMQPWLVAHNDTSGELEFVNFYPAGVVGSTYAYPGAQAKRWQACVYTAEDGTLLAIPHNHYPLTGKQNIAPAAGGYIGYVVDDDNPVIRWLACSPVAPVRGSLCAYMHDLHLGLKVCSPGRDLIMQPGDAYRASYEIFGIDRLRAGKLMARASVCAIPTAELVRNSLPPFQPGPDPFTTVDDPLQPSDAWCWTPGSEAFWDTTVGHGDTASLCIHTGDHGVLPTRNRWIVRVGPVFHGEPLLEGKRYRLSAWVRTENVSSGQGARVGYALPKGGTWQAVYSAGLLGTGDWRQVEITTEPLPATGQMALLLELDGIGKAWFDDVGWRPVTAGLGPWR